MKMSGTDHAKRLEGSYAEALASVDSLKSLREEMELTVRVLLQNVASRIAWKVEENEIRRREAISKGLPIPAPIPLVEESIELERLNRVSAALRCDRIDTGDPNAGIGGLIDMLTRARREYGSAKADSDNEVGKDTVPTETGESGAGDESRQITTRQAERIGTERPPEHRNIGTCHGKVRRGSG